MDNEHIIQAENLVKRFGKLTAVDGLDITVNKGEIYGFLGPNGAGKTTTIRLLTTMEKPTSGSIVIDGHDTRTQFLEARRCIGVIQQQNSLDKDLTVRENIFHHGMMQNLSIRKSKDRMEDLANLMELSGRMGDKVSKLSGGWKKRVSIVCSLIHNPNILFMDEPTTGLDTQSRNMLWKMIRNINNQGTTIFLTTHYIYEAESLCDRVGIIDKGRLIVEGTPAELKEMVGKFTLAIVDENGNEHTEYFQDMQSAKKASLNASAGGSISIRPTNLEDVFLELTGGKL